VFSHESYINELALETCLFTLSRFSKAVIAYYMYPSRSMRRIMLKNSMFAR